MQMKQMALCVNAQWVSMGQTVKEKETSVHPAHVLEMQSV